MGWGHMNVSYFCRYPTGAVVSAFTVPGCGTLMWEFPLVAFLQEETAPWDYTVPPPPGTYDLVMDMHVQLADVVREIVVTN